jgi:hypothetical protein
LRSQRIENRMRASERIPQQGNDKQGRTIFLIILATMVFLLVMVLVLRPQRSETGTRAPQTPGKITSVNPAH